MISTAQALPQLVSACLCLSVAITSRPSLRIMAAGILAAVSAGVLTLAAYASLTGPVTHLAIVTTVSAATLAASLALMRKWQ